MLLSIFQDRLIQRDGYLEFIVEDDHFFVSIAGEADQCAGLSVDPDRMEEIIRKARGLEGGMGVICLTDLANDPPTEDVEKLVWSIYLDHPNDAWSFPAYSLSSAEEPFGTEDQSHR